MPVDTPDIYIELLASAPLQPEGQGSPRIPDVAFHPLDPGDYDGDVTYSFEIVALNFANSQITVELIDSDLNSYATFTLPAPESRAYSIDIYDMTRQRMAFTPGAGERLYGVRCIKETEFTTALDWGNFNDLMLFTARIVVRQAAASKTRIYVPLLGNWFDTTDSKGSPSYSGDNEVEPSLGNYTVDWASYMPSGINDGAAIGAIWPFNLTDLAGTISAVRFRAYAGYIPIDTDYTKNVTIIASEDMISFQFALYKSTPGLGPCANNVGGNGFGEASYVDTCTGATFTLIPNSEFTWEYGQTYPITLTANPDFSGVADGDGIYIGGCVNEGRWGHFEEAWTMVIPPGLEGGDVSAVLTARFYSNAGREYRDVATQTIISWSGAAGELKVGLFNRTDNLLVAGSELTFLGLPEWQNVELDPSVLVDGKEYEIRVKNSCDGIAYAGYLCGAELFVSLTSVTRLTVWQRVTHSLLDFFDNWQIPDAWGTGEYGYPGVSVGSRVLCYLPASTTNVAYEATATRNNSGSPEQSYLELRDCGVTDNGATDNAVVTGSQLEWTNDLVRQRLRSGSLTLVSGNSYVDFNSFGRVNYFRPNNGFILVTVEAVPTSVSLSPSQSPSPSPSQSPSPSPSSSLSPSASPSMSSAAALIPINPYVMLQFSDDGGQTWSNEYWRPVGRIGEHRKRLIWRQLGRARDRVFKIAVSDPCKWIFLDVWIDAEIGTGRR